MMTLIDILEEHLGLGRTELLRRIAVSPRRYKVYQIPKRTGGFRTIAQPARDLKLLQRVLVDAVLSKLPVHEAAAAYREGRNIRRNAAVHSKSKVILKLDFEEFFPSIRVADWLRYCRALDPEFAGQLSLQSDEDLYVTAKVLFWGKGSTEAKCLSIGAPSSPILSNIMMMKFDTEVWGVAKKYGVAYSRYADDITLSADRSEPLLAVEAAIVRYLKKYRSPPLKLKDEKRGLYTTGQKRMVTGLIVTPDHKVSLGRHRKRTILSLVHRYGLGLLAPAEIAHVQGLVAFARDVEPAFYGTLTRKYGAALLQRLSKYRITERIPPAV